MCRNLERHGHVHATVVPALESQHEPTGLSWVEPELDVAELYLVAREPALAETLAQRCRETAVHVTESGKSRPENYLHGRRRTPAPAEAE